MPWFFFKPNVIVVQICSYNIQQEESHVNRYEDASR